MAVWQDNERGRAVEQGWEDGGWTHRETIEVLVPPWFGPRARMVVRTHHATGETKVMIDSITNDTEDDGA